MRNRMTRYQPEENRSEQNRSGENRPGRAQGSRRAWRTGAAVLLAAVTLAGCGNAAGTNAENDAEELEEAVEVTLLDVSGLFSDRDREIGYDEAECVKIVLQGNTAQSDSGDVRIDGAVVTVTAEGSYLLTGELQGQLVVQADKEDKVRLILDGASVSCESSAALYVSQADKVFVTTAADSENLLETTGEYVAIDDHNIDGAVYAREDITFNGEGRLKVVSAAGSGLVCKDDLVIGSGSYEITAGKHGLEGKDSVRIASGDIVINAEADGIHSGNDEDETVGYTYIAGGDITFTVGDDGIHSDTQLVVAGGRIRVTDSCEGLEGMCIEIAGGEIDVKAADDGLNAAGGNDGSGETGGAGEDIFAGSGEHKILISGGKLTVDAGGDGIDSNGDFCVSGGEVIVYGPVDGGNGALDYSKNASVTGGSVIALGMSQMAQNFGSDSTQCSILVNLQSIKEAGAVVELKDAAGQVIMSCVSAKSFDSVVISCADIQTGETYVVAAGGEECEIEMTETICGNGMGFGGHGGMGGPGGLGPGGPGETGGRDGFVPGGRDGFAPGGRDGQNGEPPAMPGGEPPKQPGQSGSSL